MLMHFQISKEYETETVFSLIKFLIQGFINGKSSDEKYSAKSENIH